MKDLRGFADFRGLLYLQIADGADDGCVDDGVDGDEMPRNKVAYHHMTGYYYESLSYMILNVART